MSQGYRGMPREALVVGGAAEVGQAFADLGDIGYGHVLVRHLADDQSEVLASYERLGDVRSDLPET